MTVVKLFNVIQHSQTSTSAAAEESKAARGSGKPTLPAPVMSDAKSKRKGKQKDNILGRAKESECFLDVHFFFLICVFPAAVDKDNFFDMIRSGGIVSKT